MGKKAVIKKNEIIRLEKEVIILKLSLDWSRDEHKKIPKNPPIYQFGLLRHWNKNILVVDKQ
jgi:hypothetical protein